MSKEESLFNSVQQQIIFMQLLSRSKRNISEYNCMTENSELHVKVLFDRNKNKDGIIRVYLESTTEYVCYSGKWVLNGCSNKCMNIICGRKFSFFHGRHHCRTCGDLLCYLCCSERFMLKVGTVMVPNQRQSCKNCIQTATRVAEELLAAEVARVAEERRLFEEQRVIEELRIAEEIFRLESGRAAVAIAAAVIEEECRRITAEAVSEEKAAHRRAKEAAELLAQEAAREAARKAAQSQLEVETATADLIQCSKELPGPKPTNDVLIEGLPAVKHESIFVRGGHKFLKRCRGEVGNKSTSSSKNGSISESQSVVSNLNSRASARISFTASALTSLFGGKAHSVDDEYSPNQEFDAMEQKFEGEYYNNAVDSANISPTDGNILPEAAAKKRTAQWSVGSRSSGRWTEKKEKSWEVLKKMLSSKVRVLNQSLGEIIVVFTDNNDSYQVSDINLTLGPTSAGGGVSTQTLKQAHQVKFLRPEESSFGIPVSGRYALVSVLVPADDGQYRYVIYQDRRAAGPSAMIVLPSEPTNLSQYISREDFAAIFMRN